MLKPWLCLVLVYVAGAAVALLLGVLARRWAAVDPGGIGEVANPARSGTEFQRQVSPAAPVPPGKNETLFGARISRTMTLLATSRGSYRVPVRILFYGQSITSPWWTNIVEQELRYRYPHANLVVENRAIGGFGAQMLIRTAAHDVYPMYPDLVIYQVYGGGHDGTLEAFIANVRRYTTAEIMLLTHHVRNPVYDGSDEGSSTDWRHLAQKYNCELVEVREEWRQYMEANDLPRNNLVGGDLIHLNGQGLALMASLVLRHFRYNTLFPSGWAGTVRTYEARRPMEELTDDEIVYPNEPWDIEIRCPVGTSPDNPLKLTFEGNRVDVIKGMAKSKKLGTATILIDGVPPSEHSGCYSITRPSTLDGFWWPALLRIGHKERLVPEKWTLRLTEVENIEADKKKNPYARDHFEFSYTVTGSKTGPDGFGTHQEVFVSDSGRAVIDPRDFRFESARQWRKTWPRKGFEIKWEVRPHFIDVFDASKHRTVTVAQGLTNREHTLEIIPDGNGAVPIKAIRVFCPPLK